MMEGVPAQESDEPSSRGEAQPAAVAPGSLLLAATHLTQEAFRRTVVFIISSTPDGSLGVVLNRRVDSPLVQALPAWAPYASFPAAVHAGGPVDHASAICLATLRPGVEPDGKLVRRVTGPVVLVDLSADPREVSKLVRGVRVFAGYAGWSGGQLEAEIARGDWIVVPALPSDVTGPPHPDHWAQVLRRQGLPLSLLASHPIDVGRN
jgi:putative transcriptional regulator